VRKTLGVLLEGGPECDGALYESLLRAARMNVARRQQANANMMVLFVVPGKEIDAVGARVFDAAESRREVRPILHRLELSLGERIVVRRFGPRVRFGNAEVGEQQGNGLRRHRRAAVCVNGELIGLHVLPAAAVGEKALRQQRELAVSDHPANNVAAVDVEHDVEIEVTPLARTEEFVMFQVKSSLGRLATTCCLA
jgi:hypothetical protein